jgi:oligoribonuclease NrnB/cAMP/cGMP phosphodiesterase (DHH superfamily)
MENVTQDMCEGVHDSVYCLFDMERSGAGIAWDFFHPDKDRPPLIAFVEDRDLWKFALPRSREFNANVFSYPYEFAVWDGIHKRTSGSPVAASAFRDEGAAIERKHHKDVAELVAAFKRRMTIGGQEVWAANLPYTLTSDAGHLMAQGEPFAACYWDTPEGRVFSLRSTDDGADVSEIAKAYGGGGHRNAAGFRLPHGVTP